MFLVPQLRLRSLARAARDDMRSKTSQRAIDAREHFLFSENLQQVIQARSGVAAGDGETRGMDKRANFNAELRGRRLQGRLQICRIKVLQRGKGFANGEKTRLVLRDEMFRDAVGIVFEIVLEIETAVSRQLAEDFELPFAGLERGADVIRRRIWRDRRPLFPTPAAPDRGNDRRLTRGHIRR